MLQGHCVQHIFRQVQVCEKSENLDLEPSVGSFGPPGNAGSSPLGPLGVLVLLYMVRSAPFRGVGCQIWGVKSRKSQNLAKTLEIYILKVAESEYPHAKFLRACFGVSEIEFLAKFR